jgi:hypothetical protein
MPLQDLAPTIDRTPKNFEAKFLASIFHKQGEMYGSRNIALDVGGADSRHSFAGDVLAPLIARAM